MEEIKKIAFIGATGKLAVPVIKLLTQKGFQITAIVRNVEKAQMLLPPSVKIKRGDLKEKDTIIAGLKDMDAVYINLATETDKLSLLFYEEREGVKNIVEAALKNNLKHIYKIAALGAFPGANTENMVVPNIIRLQGQKYIEECGIPYTIFDPTMFMDNIPNQIRGNKIQWIGNAAVKFYWIAASDFANQVFQAINNPAANNKHYAIQGPEALTPQEAFKIFIENYDTKITVQAYPLYLVRFMGLFNAQMKFMYHMFQYFDKSQDPFRATDTWDELGKPTITLKEYAKQLKQNK